MPPRSIPVATYRLQLRPGFGFAVARAIVPYLNDLGVSHVYASPVFTARPGSTHGYDVTDPTCLNPELGSAAEFRAFVGELRLHGMGLLLDIVPNHMSATSENAWWAHVLECGEASPYAGYFDVDWSAGGGRVLDWQAGPGMTNYRRFFSIDDLVGVRVEDPTVFDETHALAMRLLEEGTVDGLRIDHIDGLYDPLPYLRRLRARIGKSSYVAVEKIVSGDERLPRDWPVQGTTGYDFLNALNSVFVEPGGLAAIDDAYRRFARRRIAFADTVYERKRAAAIEQFVPEFRRLARRLQSLVEGDGPSGPDETSLRDVLIEVSSCLPAYRTYIREGHISDADRRRLRRAFAEAQRRAPTVNDRAFRVLRRVLLPERPPAAHRLEFVKLWQQVTGGLMAKGLEDSALYRYIPLASLNDVGADPRGPRASSTDEFHRWNVERLRTRPHSMNATTTHDTKRSEDVRARLNVLTEMSEEWVHAVERWQRLNARHRSDGAPCRNEEWLLYQTLAGAWPLDDGEVPAFRERVAAYMIKAARESAERTTWVKPDVEYERSLVEFIDALFAEQRFVADFRAFQEEIAWYGMLNALAQVVLKIGSPGVPDLYQGNELWDFSLVDPDNRRPVDFATRVRTLEGLRSAASPDAATSFRVLLDSWRDGQIKMHVTSLGLVARRERDELFTRGQYLPLYASGWARKHIVAFARRLRRSWAIVVAPRLATGLAAPSHWPLGDLVWRKACLRLPDDAPRGFRNALTGEMLNTGRYRGGNALPIGKVLDRLPVAFLMT